YDHEVTVELSKKGNKGLGLCLEARPLAPWTAQAERILDGSHVVVDANGVTVTEVAAQVKVSLKLGRLKGQQPPRDAGIAMVTEPTAGK
ncbi:hypothetical protein Ciccas_013460, partial [Cichlidogyrus casuarinus]